MADFETEVTTEEVIVTVVDLDGAAGPQGAPGRNGWTPVLAIVADDDRRVMQIISYEGGTGEAPADEGKYIGPDGPTDDITEALDVRGLIGLQGPQGEPGADGQIVVGGGANIFTEPRDPLSDNSEGENGDLWINTVTNDVFSKIAGAWALQTNIKGGPGANGAKGDPGAPGQPGGNGTNGYAPILTIAADGARAVLQVIDWTGGNGTKPPSPRYVGLTGLVTDITQAVNVRGTQGGNGTAGTNGVNGLSTYSGATDPVDTLGVNGETFINVNTTSLFRKEAGTWVFKFFMKGADSTVPGPKGDPGVQGPAGPASTVPGPKGDPGVTGAAFLTGTTNPSNALGSDGDSYANALTGDVFKKVAGAWGAAVGSFRGPQGNAGAKGDAGTRGTVWYFTNAAPGNIPGAIASDVHVNTTTGDVSQYTGAAWVDANFNIKGVQGDPGTPGQAGAQGNPGAAGASMLIGDGNPSNLLGIPGDVYLNRTTGDLFGPKGASAWPAASGNVKGGKGDQGTAGVNGLNVLSGAGAPAGALGVVGELYVNLTTQDVLKKTGATVWSQAFNMKGTNGTNGSDGAPGTNGNDGAPGQAGSNGTNGSTIYSGAGAPSNALGVVNDFYVNNTNGDLLKKTGASAWTFQINLKGANGVDAIGAADLNTFFPGKPVAANQRMMRMLVRRAFTITVANCDARAVTATTGAVTWTINKNEAAAMTFAWGAGAAVATPAGASGATTVAYAIGDRLDIFGPATVDSTQADVSMTLWGSR